MLNDTRLTGIRNVRCPVCCGECSCGRIGRIMEAPTLPPYRRIDHQGRDVTYLPGVWCDTDKLVPESLPSRVGVL